MAEAYQVHIRGDASLVPPRLLTHPCAHRGCLDTRATWGTRSRRRVALAHPAEAGSLDGALLDQRTLQRFEAFVETIAMQVRPPGKEPFPERRHELGAHRRVAMQFALVGEP